MKMLILIFISVISTTAYCGDERSGQETHGGDAVVSDFFGLTYSMLQKCNPKKASELPESFCETFRQAIEKTNVISSDKVELNGTEVDAINIPQNDPPQIILSRNRWLNPNYSLDYKENLIIHEYLSIMNLDDRHYLLSRKIIEILNKEGN